MYLNINGIGPLLQVTALASLLALGIRLFSLKRRRPGFVRVYKRRDPKHFNAGKE